MQEWLRFMALVIALCEFLAAYLIGGSGVAAKFLLYLLLPIFCILWPQDMGDFTGSIMIRPNINHATPAWLISFGGWLLLLLPIGVYAYMT